MSAAADIATIRTALLQAEGDITAARAALARATDMFAAVRRQLDVLAAREAARVQGGGGSGAAGRGSVAAGVEAQVGDFAGGLA